MLTKDIAKALSARLDGDGEIEIERVVHPDDARRPSDLAVAIADEAAASLERTQARAVVASAKRAPASGRFAAVVLVDPARSVLAVLTALFDPGPVRAPGVHPTAIVAPDAHLGEAVSIGPGVVIGPRSRIGARTAILPHVSIGAGVAIGADGLIHCGARIGDRVEIGDRVIIQCNAVIGADGFSFAPELGSQLRYPPDLALMRVHSLGGVVIGDDVEIGAATTIDRSTLQATRIGRGTKIDNHVHVGHNVVIGDGCIICGMVGISGSVRIGDRVRIGGGVGIADHVRIGTEAVIAAGSGVGTNVPDGLTVSGYPAMSHERSLEFFRYLGRQKALHKKLDHLQARIEELEKSTAK
jgi:UDP-3-O-[3-hydroxymyristoyl] glucosamine N-acyltransferase